jgi:hypothetical protein
VEIGDRAAIGLAQALVDEERLVPEILQIRIHPGASREAAGWFHTLVITGLVPVIPMRCGAIADRDGRDKPSHDVVGLIPGRSVSRGKL